MESGISAVDLPIVDIPSHFNTDNLGGYYV